MQLKTLRMDYDRRACCAALPLTRIGQHSPGRRCRPAVAISAVIARCLTRPKVDLDCMRAARRKHDLKQVGPGDIDA
ncbi:hypothetical protein FHR22_002155 [Sphingopyxis panaciterrae]|uniref:hypothetical protein n=1 Tax=Sphingopyxis panaciterrae TaxID=363841 RepID=UPI001422D50B|nr:hypothetical protein [Sphingopyxis panaciterrae]NIJ37471.1 hypothetical protein [Sphingopyxis panaciterrae]